MRARVEVLIEVYVLTAPEGGRSTPFFSSYRGQFYYDNSNWAAQYFILDKVEARPGEMVTLEVQTASPETHFGKFEINKRVEIREGQTTVARGKVISIIDPRFRKT